jgi:hypothetical protein
MGWFGSVCMEFGIGIGIARCLRGISTGVYCQARCLVITVNDKQDKKCMKVSNLVIS